MTTCAPPAYPFFGGTELARAYALYVLPSALFARLDLNRLAYRTYRAMMDDLTRRLA